MYSIHFQPFRRLLYEYLAFHNILEQHVRDNEHEVRGHYNKSLHGDDLWPVNQNNINKSNRVLS